MMTPLKELANVAKQGMKDLDDRLKKKQTPQKVNPSNGTDIPLFAALDWTTDVHQMSKCLHWSEVDGREPFVIKALGRQVQPPSWQ